MMAWANAKNFFNCVLPTDPPAWIRKRTSLFILVAAMKRITVLFLLVRVWRTFAKTALCSTSVLGCGITVIVVDYITYTQHASSVHQPVHNLRAYILKIICSTKPTNLTSTGLNKSHIYWSKHISLSHSCKLHPLEPENDPAHLPTSEHVLDLYWIPPPHVFEHFAQVVQSLHFAVKHQKQKLFGTHKCWHLPTSYSRLGEDS